MTGCRRRNQEKQPEKQAKTQGQVLLASLDRRTSYLVMSVRGSTGVTMGGVGF